MPKDENTLILGIGGVGMHLAHRLVNEGYAITVIESDSELLEQASENLDARLICGNATVSYTHLTLPTICSV